MKILKIQDVIETTKLGRSTIYAWAKSGDFPPPIKLGTRSSGWLEDDIVTWIRDKKVPTFYTTKL